MNHCLAVSATGQEEYDDMPLQIEIRLVDIATNAVASIKKPRTNRGLMVYNNPLILVPNGSEQFPAVNDTISTGRHPQGRRYAGPKQVLN